tara:strand:+ start:316 stop:432 length:117 start_codon:yes stop_codon:yes gene_type:complete
MKREDRRAKIPKKINIYVERFITDFFTRYIKADIKRKN